MGGPRRSGTGDDRASCRRCRDGGAALGPVRDADGRDVTSFDLPSFDLPPPTTSSTRRRPRRSRVRGSRWRARRGTEPRSRGRGWRDPGRRDPEFRGRRHLRPGGHHAGREGDEARRVAQVPGLVGIAGDQRGLALEAGIAGRGGQAAAGRAGIVPGAGRVEGVDRRQGGVVARAAVIAVDEERRRTAGLRESGRGEAAGEDERNGEAHRSDPFVAPGQRYDKSPVPSCVEPSRFTPGRPGSQQGP